MSEGDHLRYTLMIMPAKRFIFYLNDYYFQIGGFCMLVSKDDNSEQIKTEVPSFNKLVIIDHKRKMPHFVSHKFIHVKIENSWWTSVKLGKIFR